MPESLARRAVLGGAAGLAALAATTGTATADPTVDPTADRGARGRFCGKVVAITGATSGIGRETALLFAAAGAKVGFCGRRPTAGQRLARLDPLRLGSVHAPAGQHFRVTSSEKRSDSPELAPTKILGYSSPRASATWPTAVLAS